MSKKKTNRGDGARLLKHAMHASTPEELGDAMEKFLVTITGEAEKGENLPSDTIDDHSGWYPLSGGERVIDFKDLNEFQLNTAIGKLLVELKKAFKTAEKRSYNEGLAQGKNLLMGLNKGDISISDFDAAVTKYTLPKKKS